MRGAYLKPCDSGHTGSSRGGVGSAGDSPDYELEIGQSQNASCEMLAHCSLIDEIHEFLRKTDSPLARLILAQYRDEVQRLETALANARNVDREQAAGRRHHEQVLEALASRYGPDCLDGPDDSA